MSVAFHVTSHDPNQNGEGVVLIGKAPHSKCGVRKHMGVRVPPPPLMGLPLLSCDGQAKVGEVHCHGAWLSPVERCVRVAEVPGSNPGAPIIPVFEGRVAEWLKAHDWKSCGHLPAWVRIPPRPLSASEWTGWGFGRCCSWPFEKRPLWSPPKRPRRRNPRRQTPGLPKP